MTRLLCQAVAVALGVWVLSAQGHVAAQTAPADQSGPPLPAEGGSSGLHDAHEVHGAGDESSSDEPGRYFTVNVSIGDEGIQPSDVFIPLGRRVQLMLRTRNVAEHHYRVVGLAPEGLNWIAEPDPAAHESDEHHHARMFMSWRGASPGGVTPTGREVHGYVTPGRGIDVVVFTAAHTGRFEVRCDLHSEVLGSMTVFESGQDTTTAPGARGGQALMAALTRKLGSGAEEAAADVEAMYVPAEHEARFLGPAGAAAPGASGSVALLVTERTHTQALASTMPAPALYVGGQQRPLLDSKVIATSVHHRATAYRFAADDRLGRSHQVMTLRLASGQEGVWHLPIAVPAAGLASAPVGLGQSWALVLALLGGMVGAMWPCLFQLTVYFIPALAGIAMQDTGEAGKQERRRQVLRAAFFFILGFTLVYTATGAAIGYAAQRFSDSTELETWQRYFGIGAGIIVIGLALRVAVKVRAPLVCRMPVLSWMSRSTKAASPMEMMLAGLAFATSCMTCFGSALVVVMVVYVGLAQSAFYGGLVLFLFSLGMGVPLVLAAIAMSRALPILLRLETAVPWMGLVSAVVMIGFGILLITGNYMLVSEWTYRLVA